MIDIIDGFYIKVYGGSFCMIDGWVLLIAYCMVGYGGGFIRRGPGCG